MVQYYCRCCLATNVRMVKISEAALNENCLSLIGIVIQNPYLSLCYVCAAKLNNCNKFWKQCIRVNNALIDVLKQNNCVLTQKDLKKVDREVLQLESQYEITPIYNAYTNGQYNTNFPVKVQDFEVVYLKDNMEVESEEKEASLLNLEVPKDSDTDSDGFESDEDTLGRLQVIIDCVRDSQKEYSKHVNRHSSVDNFCLEDHASHKIAVKNTKTEEKRKNGPILVIDSTEENCMKKEPILVIDSTEENCMKKEPILVIDSTEENCMKKEPILVIDSTEENCMKKEPILVIDSTEENCLKKRPILVIDSTEENSLKKGPMLVIDSTEENCLKKGPMLVIDSTEENSLKKGPMLVIDNTEENCLKKRPILVIDSGIVPNHLGLKLNHNELLSDEEDCPTSDNFNFIEDNSGDEDNNEQERNVNIKLKHNADCESMSLEELLQATSPLGYEYLPRFFDIETLTPESAKNEVLLRKESDNYRNSKYKCNLCFRGFLIFKTYQNHLKKHSYAFGKFECPICLLCSTTKSRMKLHVKQRHHQKYTCTICSKVYYSMDLARNHLITHQGIQYPCDLCDRTFNLAHCLANHKRMCHKHNSVCELCGSTFPSARGMQAHRKFTHGLEENKKEGPKCEKCDAHFSTEMAWKRHLVLSDNHNVSYGCKICGETFTDEIELRKHKRSHVGNETYYSRSGPTTYVCPLCKTTLSSQWKYKRHLSIEHPSASADSTPPLLDNCYMCDQCGKVFKSRSMLSWHLNQHSGAKPYSCKKCAKAFDSPIRLGYHNMKAHSSQVFSPQQCKICQKVLKTKSTLAKHMMIHTGERPYKCHICDKSYPTRCEVKYHARHIHFKVPWPKRDRSKRKKTDKTDSRISV